MKDQLKLFIGQNVYSLYSYARSEYDLLDKLLCFENECILHLKTATYFKFKIEPLDIWDFEHDLSIMSIEKYDEENGGLVYSNLVSNITICLLATYKEIQKVEVFGFPINETLREHFPNDKTTANFILMYLDNGRKLFFDTSRPRATICIMDDLDLIESRINHLGLVKDYSI